MKIKTELLSIQRYPTMPDGTPVEPEQQPAARIIETEAQAKMRDGGPVIGALPARFIMETTAGEAAQKARSMCRSCKHFKRKAWIDYVKAADHPMSNMDHRRVINEVRFAIEAQQSDEVRAMHTITNPQTGEADFDTEHALRSMGFCAALGEIAKDEIVVHPLGSCPTEQKVGDKMVPIATPERPTGLYEPKSLEAEREATKEYDRIMATAAGKLP